MILRRMVHRLSRNALLLDYEKRMRLDDWSLLMDPSSKRTRGFNINLEVDHENKKIYFETETMTNYERVTIFMKEKNRIRNIFPDYILTEHHT